MYVNKIQKLILRHLFLRLWEERIGMQYTVQKLFWHNILMHLGAISIRFFTVILRIFRTNLKEYLHRVMESWDLKIATNMNTSDIVYAILNFIFLIYELLKWKWTCMVMIKFLGPKYCITEFSDWNYNLDYC